MKTIRSAPLYNVSDFYNKVSCYLAGTDY